MHRHIQVILQLSGFTRSIFLSVWACLGGLGRSHFLICYFLLHVWPTHLFVYHLIIWSPLRPEEALSSWTGSKDSCGLPTTWMLEMKPGFISGRGVLTAEPSLKPLISCLQVWHANPAAEAAWLQFSWTSCLHRPNHSVTNTLTILVLAWTMWLLGSSFRRLSELGL